MYCDGRDMLSILETGSINWDKMRNKTVLITGATGLIGTTLVNALLYANEKLGLDISVVCIVRNKEKAKEHFLKDVKLYVSDINDIVQIDEKIDFIIHAASPTSSSFFINSPVETIQTAIRGTTNILNLAKDKEIESLVYLSSMEVYGYPQAGYLVKESDIAGLDTTVTRNCYPLSKQLCENLCKAYQSEYNVPAKVVRLTQTFGPGVEYDDGRVFAEFMRCAVENRNIVLHTDGKTERCYLYTADAVSAILTVLISGKDGEAYTAANPATYCSIVEMAELVTREIADGKIGVDIHKDKTERGYASEMHMKLDTTKLESLGWKPTVGLAEMFRRMIAGLAK